MKTKMKLTVTTFIAVAIMLLGSASAYAGFGVSPTNIYNEYLKPGSKFERTITLSRSDPIDDLDIIIEPSLGEIESWFRYEPGLKFVFPRGANRISFKVLVDVPQDATYRGYEGVIRVKATKKGEDVKGVSIVKGARLDVDLATTQTNFSLLNVKTLKMLDSVDGEPLKLEIIAENEGNVEISPNAKIVIKNLQMEDLEEHEANGFGSIKPNETGTLYATFNSSLPEGEYFVEASVLVNSDVVRKERLVFRINGQPSADSEKEDNKLIGGLMKFMQENGVYILVVVILAVLLYLAITKVWNIKRFEKIKGEKWAKLLGVEVRNRVLLSILLSIVITGGYIAISKEVASRQEERKIAKEKELEAKEQKDPEGIELTITTGTEVKGVQTNTDLDVNGEPLFVGGEKVDGKPIYPIYTQPDKNSYVVYRAREDEQFTVIDERADWYRVEIKGEGVSGWLEKSSVKSSDSSE